MWRTHKQLAVAVLGTVLSMGGAGGGCDMGGMGDLNSLIGALDSFESDYGYYDSYDSYDNGGWNGNNLDWDLLDVKSG